MRHSVTVTRAVCQKRPQPVAEPRRVLVALLLPVVVLGWALARPDVHLHRASTAMRVWAWGPVYAVKDVERALAQNPTGWVGRTVLVQGRVALDRTWSPPDSIVTRVALVDPGRSNSLRPLYLQWGSADPVLTALRRLPLLGRFAPPPQRLQVGLPAIYRVRLGGVSTGPSGTTDVVLLDADPDAR